MFFDIYDAKLSGTNILHMKINHMTINREELVFLREERKINVGYVFLEKSDRPTSDRGRGIPAGILMLTNRRLFFFDTGVHTSRLKTAGKIAGNRGAEDCW